MNFFFPLIELFSAFVVSAKMRVTMGFRTKNAGYSTGLSQVCATSYWLPCGVDGRTDGHVTITSLPKFLDLIGYQICLAMVLHYKVVDHSARLRKGLKSTLGHQICN